MSLTFSRGGTTRICNSCVPRAESYSFRLLEAFTCVSIKMMSWILRHWFLTVSLFNQRVINTINTAWTMRTNDRSWLRIWSGQFLFHIFYPFLANIALISVFCLTDGAVRILPQFPLILPPWWQVFTLERVMTDIVRESACGGYLRG